MGNRDVLGEVTVSSAKPDRLNGSLNSQCVQSVQSMGRRDGPGKVVVNSAKPDRMASSMNIQSGMKLKKKVWVMKSNGLYGWKTQILIHNQHMSPR